MTWFRPLGKSPFYTTVATRPPGRVLEISSRSPQELGRDLSAMNLRAAGDPRERTVEAVYQAAKCYGAGGPDTAHCTSGYAAKRRDRERRRGGPLAGFEHEGLRWKTPTGSAFYDWLWTRSALASRGEAVVARLQEYDAFSDQFHRPGAVACQAKAAAIAAGMGIRRLRTALEQPAAWLSHLNGREADPPASPEPAVAQAPARIYAGVGSRTTPAAVLDTMETVAEAMARHGWTLRSGAAAGADSAFEAGAIQGGGSREIWLPWPGFNGREDDGSTRLGRNSGANRDRARQCHPTWHTLSDAAQKLMVRNVHQILGPEPGHSPAADLVLCWSPGGSGRGGTGMAIRLAERHRIPVVDLGAADVEIERSIARARARGLPDDVATRITAGRTRSAAQPGPRTYRILVTGSVTDAETATLEQDLDGIAAAKDRVAVIVGEGRAADVAVAWAARRGHPTIAPPPGESTRPESPVVRAAQPLAARPDLVLECGGDWDPYRQAARNAAEAGQVPVRSCEGIAKRPTGVEHHAEAVRAERERPKPKPDTPAPRRRPRPRGRYLQVDAYVADQLRLTEPSGRIVRAAARRHGATAPDTIRRALFITASGKRRTLLRAAHWTTSDRLEHDPLGVLTRGADRDELTLAARVARTIVTALARAGLQKTESRNPEPSTEGTRQRAVAAAEPPLAR